MSVCTYCAIDAHERCVPRGCREVSRSSGSRVEHGTLGGYTNHGCRCEACRAAAAAYHRAYYEANKDEIAAKNRAYYEANKDEIAEKQRAYYEANKDEIAEKQRAYYEANKPTGPLVRTCTACGDDFEQERRQAHPFMRCEACRDS